MHIRILPLLLLSVSLCACSSSGQDSPVDPDPEPNPGLVGIAFGSNSGAWKDAPTSRAAEAGLETLFPSFRVWGYKTTADATQTVMDGYHVLYTANTSGNTPTNTANWEYVGIQNPTLSTSQTIKYWDYSASSYRFFAYSPVETNVTVSADATTTSFAYGYDIDTTTCTPYMSDLWTSTNAADGPRYGECVKLTFSPLLAKVRFKFTYPDGVKASDIKVKDIQFCDSRYIDNAEAADTPLRGSLITHYPHTTAAGNAPTYSWQPAAGNATGRLVLTVPYEEASDIIHAVDDERYYGKWYLVPPLDAVPYEQGPYTISARINGNHTTAAVPAAYMQWKAGYQYTYIFKVTHAGTDITFADLQVEQWLTGENIDNDGTGTAGW